MDSDAIISDTTNPAPKRFTKRRNGKSLIPDMGASRTGASSAIEPIMTPIFWAFLSVMIIN
jgi:hypothetical protein